MREQDGGRVPAAGGAMPRPDDDIGRVAALRALGILDTEPDDRFDRVTRLAQRMFDVPIALVGLVDADRQWNKSHTGFELAEMPREASFCSWAILGDDVLHVTDAFADARFAGNPLVVGDPKIRFYAGQPIAGPTGHRLGTLCVIDREPRPWSAEDAVNLRALASLVEQAIATSYLDAVDELTGLVNQRGFELVATEVLELCVHVGLRCSLLSLELDGLEPINDHFGDDEGDRALRTFADLLHATYRSCDVVARLGDDRFAVLLSGAEAADGPAGRLRAAIDTHNRSTAGRWALAASIGRADVDPSAPVALAALLEAADAAMYDDRRRRRQVGGSERGPTGPSAV